MDIRQETITPEMAQEYLKFNTENYRSLNKLRVISYSNDMKAGKWQLNGEAIKFDTEGKLIDGQHRLQAIVRANVPVKMLVIRGIQEGVNLYDIGSTRSMGQIAKARGIVEGWYSQVMACASWIVNNGESHGLAGKSSHNGLRRKERGIDHQGRAVFHAGSQRRDLQEERHYRGNLLPVAGRL